MARLQTEQQRFTQGEIDPLMIERGDLEQYYGGVARAKNVVSLRQGGLASRPGLRFVHDLPISDHKLFEFRVDENIRYLLVFSYNRVDIFRNFERKATIISGIFTHAVIPSLSVTYRYDTIYLFAAGMKPQKLFRQTETNWTLEELEFTVVPHHAFSLQTIHPERKLYASEEFGTVRLTLHEYTGQIFLFTSKSVGQIVEGNGGRARITKLITGEEVEAEVEIDFNGKDMQPGSWSYISGYEEAWGDTRGWPTCGTFYEGRLWLAATPSLPTTIWASRVGEYLNFDNAIGHVYDDSPMEVTLDVSDNITNILAGRSLQAFTLGSEHIAMQGLGDPITPGTVNFKMQTSIGSKPNLQAFDVEGATIFCSKNSIHEFVYEETQGAYTSGIISLLFGHLVRNPLDFCVRRSYSDQGATYIGVVTEDNGLTLVNILSSQGVMAATRQDTGGRFLNCGTDGEEIYVVAERKVYGQTVHYLEVFADGYLLDCSAKATLPDPAQKTVGGFIHLMGEMVNVVADGVILPDARVSSSGTITIDREADTYNVEAGLKFDSQIIDLPVQTPQQGSVLGMRKHVDEVVVSLKDTTNCNVGVSANPGRLNKITFRGFGGAALNSPLPVFTGIKHLQGFKGWDERGQVIIERDVPGTMTVLSLAKKVSISL